jgi:hypothetical protein
MICACSLARGQDTEQKLQLWKQQYGLQRWTSKSKRKKSRNQQKLNGEQANANDTAGHSVSWTQAAARKGIRRIE